MLNPVALTHSVARNAIMWGSWVTVRGYYSTVLLKSQFWLVRRWGIIFYNGRSDINSCYKTNSRFILMHSFECAIISLITCTRTCKVNGPQKMDEKTCSCWYGDIVWEEVFCFIYHFLEGGPNSGTEIKLTLSFPTRGNGAVSWLHQKLLFWSY